jgi:hypothetical protein
MQNNPTFKEIIDDIMEVSKKLNTLDESGQLRNMFLDAMNVYTIAVKVLYGDEEQKIGMNRDEYRLKIFEASSGVNVEKILRKKWDEINRQRKPNSSRSCGMKPKSDKSMIKYKEDNETINRVDKELLEEFKNELSDFL